MFVKLAKNVRFMGNHTHTLPHHFALPGTAAGGEVAPPTQAELIKYLGTLSSYIAELDLPSNSLSNKTSEHASHHSCTTSLE
jgi:hypothetical protein